MVKPYSEEEMAFLRQVPDLPGDLSLTPEQAALVIGETTDWLRKKRQGSEGAGPPFEQHGEGEKAPVRYPLAALRKWKEGRTYSTTREARVGAVYGRFMCFLAAGGLGDTSVFSDGPDGRPLPAEKGYELTLSDYLDRVKDAARARDLLASADDLAAGIGMPEKRFKTPRG
jgi:hypothetical protein